MFQNLGDRLSGIFDRLKKRGVLNEEDVTLAMREVRVALLEADVSLSVVKDFVTAVREKAIGQEVLRSVTPGQMVVKIVHDHLVEVLGHQSVALNLNAAAPVCMMMVGLQGSGKTTTTAKLAKLLTQDRKKVLMASADIYRPAAKLQLETLGQQIQVDTLPILDNESALDIAKRAYKMAKLEGYDVLFVDTAGRLHIDDALMHELQEVKEFLQPAEVMLVADAMTGQEAVSIAETFHHRLHITGITLTRIDGDARGGAALSMRSVTGCPIKYMGVGERVNQIEPFHPDRIAGRILDMGDVVTLVEKAAANIDEEEAKRMASRAASGRFDFNDLASQLQQVSKLGGMGGLMSMLPGIGKMKQQIQQAGIDDKMVARQLAIIRSMTKKERCDAKLLNSSRRKRIAAGSGTSVQDVNRLVKQYTDMSRVMKQMGKLGEKGLRRQGLASLFKR